LVKCLHHVFFSEADWLNASIMSFFSEADWLKYTRSLGLPSMIDLSAIFHAGALSLPRVFLDHSFWGCGYRPVVVVV
jgi:hypothetical protein